MHFLNRPVVSMALRLCNHPVHFHYIFTYSSGYIHVRYDRLNISQIPVYVMVMMVTMVVIMVMMVVFMIMSMAVIMFIIVFLIGHPLNIAINLLGAYVHTNRLQFVEFFGKFYEGGGREFEPLANHTKYYKLK